jgi:hypothetical protein
VDEKKARRAALKCICSCEYLSVKALFFTKIRMKKSSRSRVYVELTYTSE